MSKRENSSLILQNLKKRELLPLGEPVVSLDQAERAVGSAANVDSTQGTEHDSYPDSMLDSIPDQQSKSSFGTRLKPRERVARSALIVRLDPALHRRLEEVARFNRLTMNDIATEAIELHLQHFPHPGEIYQKS